MQRMRPPGTAAVWRSTLAVRGNGACARYYQDQYGNNWHGWAKIKESAGQYWHKYYFAQNGEMVTGDQWIDDKYRLFMRTGALEGALCISDGEGEQKVLNLSE